MNFSVGENFGERNKRNIGQNKIGSRVSKFKVENIGFFVQFNIRTKTQGGLHLVGAPLDGDDFLGSTVESILSKPAGRGADVEDS